VIVAREVDERFAAVADGKGDHILDVPSHETWSFREDMNAALNPCVSSGS
jgi:hypothetical protein